jgi:hypothetical protein
MSAQEAAQLILDWVELSGEGPPTAWPTTCGCAVHVARAYLALVERERNLRAAIRRACDEIEPLALGMRDAVLRMRAALEDRT